MPAFTYIALDGSGKQVNGSLTVGTRAEAYRKLEAQRLTPVKVSEEAKKADAREAAKRRRRRRPRC